MTRDVTPLCSEDPDRAEEEVVKLGQKLNTIRNDILDEWKYTFLKLHNGERSPDDDDDDAAPPKKKVRSFIPSSHLLKKVVSRHEIAKKIINVKAHLDEILEEANKYGFKIYEPTTYPLPEFGRVQSTSFINTEDVQGRGRDVDTLVDKLMGNGGSQEESGIQTAIAKGILGSIEKGSSQGADQLDELIKRVRERIKGNKFLLVLDDVWTEESLDGKFLRNCLGCGGAGSKILVTTRSERVAKTMGKSEIFRPGLLSDDDCWLILCCTTDLERNEVEIFVDVGKKIGKKCSGLPLAATTLGGILCFKKSLGEWENVLNDKIWEMKKAEDEIFRPLLMSYKELSPMQKQCFSYCAAFPKDYRIKVESLIGKWMALGYLGSNSDDMELKGKECFDVLAMRSLIQDFNMINSGREEAGGVEVAVEMNKSKRSQACDPSQVSNVDEFCTLYCDEDSPPNLCNRVVRLRVLSLARCGLEGVTREMDKLIHLRWLDLSGNKLSTKDLKFIFQLYFLQTLNLSGCSLEEIPNEIENRLKELPSEIGNLKQLRHLDLDDNDDLKELPSEIGKLSFLKTIILPDRATIQIPEALGQLTGLRKLMGFKGGSGWSKLGLLKNLNQLAGFVRLRIRLDGMDLKGIVEDSREANFSNKKYIESLELEFEDEMGEEGSSRMDVIDALKPHPNLRMLYIWSYKGSKLPLWIVWPANQLRKELIFANCEKWKEWEDITTEEEESSAFQVMPYLTTLEIAYCRGGLTALPHRLLRKARSLEILNIHKSFGLQCYKNKEGTNWKSISLNNPRLQIQD
ncbi:hypothetical protein ACS0TY_023053 [Phlomoides rotata]